MRQEVTGTMTVDPVGVLSLNAFLSPCPVTDRWPGNLATHLARCQLGMAPVSAWSSCKWLLMDGFTSPKPGTKEWEPLFFDKWLGPLINHQKSCQLILIFRTRSFFFEVSLSLTHARILWILNTKLLAYVLTVTPLSWHLALMVNLPALLCYAWAV